MTTLTLDRRLFGDLGSVCAPYWVNGAIAFVWSGRLMRDVANRCGGWIRLEVAIQDTPGVRFGADAISNNIVANFSRILHVQSIRDSKTSLKDTTSKK
jgi:hypothetical protein